jgi:hypothetical protein
MQTLIYALLLTGLVAGWVYVCFKHPDWFIIRIKK